MLFLIVFCLVWFLQRRANEISEVAKPSDLKYMVSGLQSIGLAATKTEEDVLVGGISK